jgi:hypothetical protein
MLFTLVVEVGDQVFVAQTVAASIDDVSALLASDIEWTPRSELAERILRVPDDDYSPVALDGLTNVWCMSRTVDDVYVHINVVATNWLD